MLKTQHMKWEYLPAKGNEETYSLCHNEKELLRLYYHPFTNSARVEYAQEKRVFLIRKEGFLRNKTVLCNEYGIRIGQLGRGHDGGGVLEINQERFSYNIHNNPLAEIVIAKENDPEEPLFTCGLKTNNGSAQIELTSKPDHILAPHFLLMALCWYLFLPVAKENVLEYAL